MARLIVVVISAVCLFVLSSADGSLGGRSGAPANLTDYGRTVWNLEALLRDTFGPKEVWLQYRGQITPKAAWNFSTVVTANCCGGSYHYTFAAATNSTFYTDRPTRPPRAQIGGSGGEIPLTVRKAYISCGRGRWLFHHVGNGPANWLVSCHR